MINEANQGAALKKKKEERIEEAEEERRTHAHTISIQSQSPYSCNI